MAHVPSRSVRSTTAANRRKAYSTRQNTPAPGPQTKQSSATAAKSKDSASLKATKRKITRSTRSAASGPALTKAPAWTREERVVLHLLNARYPGAPSIRLQIFNRVFQDLHARWKLQEGRDKFSLRCQYGDRLKRDRQGCWRGILDESDEAVAWEEWREKIQSVEGDMKGEEGSRGEGESSELTEYTVRSQEGEDDIEVNVEMQESGLTGLVSFENGEALHGQEQEPVPFDSDLIDPLLKENPDQIRDQETTEDSTLTDRMHHSADDEAVSPAHPPRQAQNQEQHHQDSASTDPSFTSSNIQVDATAPFDTTPPLVNGDEEQLAIPSTLLDTESAAPPALSQQTTNPLPFLHSTSLIWGGNTPYIPTHLPFPPPIPPSPPGGRVHRVLDRNRQAADYIICAPQTCSTCSPSATASPAASIPAPGLPFLHTADLRRTDAGHLAFHPSPHVPFDRHLSPWTASRPRRVVFGDGGARTVAVCVYQTCGVCAAAALRRRGENCSGGG